MLTALIIIIIIIDIIIIVVIVFIVSRYRVIIIIIIIDYRLDFLYLLYYCFMYSTRTSVGCHLKKILARVLRNNKTSDFEFIGSWIKCNTITYIMICIAYFTLIIYTLVVLFFYLHNAAILYVLRKNFFKNAAANIY